jgi:hypothetical protein
VPRTDHIAEFFTLARAMSARAAGRPSRDPIFDSMVVFHPTAPPWIERHVAALAATHGLRLAMVDWWTGGEVGRDDSKLRARVLRWLSLPAVAFDQKVEDLAWLDGLRTVKLPREAPGHKVAWQGCAEAIRRVEATPVRSLGQVYDHLKPVVGPYNILHLIRVVRPSFGDLPDPHWIPVGGAAACGLSWAVAGAPFGLHPVDHRQDEARVKAQVLLERSRDPELWPPDEYPFTIDALMMFCEVTWAYLKRRYPHLKDPWGAKP